MTKRKLAKGTAARSLLRRRDSGLLATISLELPGYPFGSVTPYVLLPDGRCVIYVSSIAQHTHNMNADPKVSLTVTEQGDAAQQALGRVTIVGDATLVPEAALPAARDRYFAFFPSARKYEDTHDFSLYWITPKRVRYIGGFGAIFWIEADRWALPEPEWAESESHITTHMNDDHADSVAAIARHFGVDSVESAEVLAVDVEGFHIRAKTPSGERILYILFPEACSTLDAVRAAMVALARRASATDDSSRQSA